MGKYPLHIPWARPVANNSGMAKELAEKNFPRPAAMF